MMENKPVCFLGLQVRHYLDIDERAVFQLWSEF